MMHIDIDLFDYVVKRAKTTRDAVASACDCNRSTLYRHLKNGSITVNEMHAIIAFLKLSWEDVVNIFFAKESA